MIDPTLTTERLLLRPHRLIDFENIVRLWTAPEVTRFTSGNRPSTHEECWARLLRYQGMWPLLGFGYFAIFAKETGAFLGEAGLADFHRDITPSLHGHAEAGWAMLPDAWGKGFATEALKIIFEWYETLKSPRPVSCIINPENSASLRLAARCGFQEIAKTEYKGLPCLMLQRVQHQTVSMSQAKPGK